jgi:hypothetical protein
VDWVTELIEGILQAAWWEHTGMPKGGFAWDAWREMEAPFRTCGPGLAVWLVALEAQVVKLEREAGIPRD